MVTATRVPTAALAPFVVALGYTEGAFDHGRELALPSATTQILVNLDRDELHSWSGTTVCRTGGAALQGASSRPVQIDPAEQRAIAWIGFRVGGAYPFFAMPAAVLRDELVDLGDLWGRDGVTLRERLLEASTAAAKLDALEAALLDRVARPLARDPALIQAAKALHSGASVAEASELLGWSTRRLGSLFAEQVGIAPKRFARIRRFQRLLDSANRSGASRSGPDWARLAAEHGYHDQAHLIHEFQALAGMTPGTYRPRSAEERNHVPLTE